MRDTVRFILAGRVEEVRNCAPTLTVLEYLREIKGLKGSKEGCAEGDCGACTVVVGELHGNGIRYRAVNSCIQFLATLDGKLLVTVEDLAGDGGSLHAVQQALVEQHGSQCGFCTPGFVMSLFAMFHNDRELTLERAEITSGLAGNLCRCTGYAPIVRAAEQALKARRSDGFNERESHLLELLSSIQSSEPLALKSDAGRFYSPCTLQQLHELLKTHPRATLVAGGTDVGLWVTKQQQTLDTVIYLGALKALKRIHDNGSYLSIGAAVSYTDANDAIINRYPGFAALIQRIGAVQVRNAGTIGGNIANGSPIGDMPPGLIALDAKLVLLGPQGERLLDLEDFFISYGNQDLQPGEFVSQIHLPPPTDGQLFASYKVSKRAEQDISAVCGAFSLQVDDSTIRHARVCYGGMAATPKRARACERALEGKAFNQQTIEQAMLAMASDFSPITDMRASSAYRMRVAQNLLHRFYLEQTTRPYPVSLGPPYTDRFQAPSDGRSGNGE